MLSGRGVERGWGAEGKGEAINKKKTRPKLIDTDNSIVITRGKGIGGGRGG